MTPARRPPKFYYVGPHKSHHWVRHTFSSSVNDVLNEDVHDFVYDLRPRGVR